MTAAVQSHEVRGTERGLDKVNLAGLANPNLSGITHPADQSVFMRAREAQVNGTPGTLSKFGTPTIHDGNPGVPGEKTAAASPIAPETGRTDIGSLTPQTTTQPVSETTTTEGEHKRGTKNKLIEANGGGTFGIDTVYDKKKTPDQVVTTTYTPDSPAPATSQPTEMKLAQATPAAGPVDHAPAGTPGKIQDFAEANRPAPPQVDVAANTPAPKAEPFAGLKGRSDMALTV